MSFHVKFVQTDGRTDRWTTVKQYAPRSFDTGAHKNLTLKISDRGLKNLSIVLRLIIEHTDCIVWFLMPFSTVFQLYHGGQCTYPCFPGVSVLPKPLAALPHNQHFRLFPQYFLPY